MKFSVFECSFFSIFLMKNETNEEKYVQASKKKKRNKGFWDEAGDTRWACVNQGLVSVSVLRCRAF
jgi:hypothetical protein